MDLKIIRNKLVGNDQERAVSPVIGVILMVAITVILAAVIAAFVLDMGNSMGNSAPTTGTEMSINDGWNGDSTGEELAYVTHQTGDSIAGEDLRVVVREGNGATIASFSGTNLESDPITADFDGDGSNEDAVVSMSLDGEGSDLSGEEFGAGSTITISTDYGAMEDSSSGTQSHFYNVEEVTVQVVHTPSDTTVADLTEELA